MDELETKLLVMIGNGVTTFEPALRTSKELLRFQEMTRVLLKLERDGLIHRCLTVESEIAGQRYFERVHILGGLTQEGKVTLEDLSREGQA